MGFEFFFLPGLALLALVPLVYRQAKRKAASAGPVATISLARFRLLAAIIEQRKSAAGPQKLPTLLFVAATLAAVAWSGPTPSIPAAGHGLAVVVGVEAASAMNAAPPPGVEGATRFDAAKSAAKSLISELGPGDPAALLLYETNPVYRSSLGASPALLREVLDSVPSGFGGNSPARGAVEAARILGAASAPRRVAVFFGSGEALNEEDYAQAAATVREIETEAGARVEGYFVYLGQEGARAPLEGVARNLGWAVVDLQEWSPAQIVSGPADAPGETPLSLVGFLAVAAFGLLAYTVFREVRK